MSIIKDFLIKVITKYQTNIFENFFSNLLFTFEIIFEYISFSFLNILLSKISIFIQNRDNTQLPLAYTKNP